MMRGAKQLMSRFGLGRWGTGPHAGSPCAHTSSSHTPPSTLKFAATICALATALSLWAHSGIEPGHAQTTSGGTTSGATSGPVPNAPVNPFNLNPIDPRTGRPFSSFPPQKGGILGGPTKKPDKAQPLLLEGDELIYDTKNNRVIARGNVQIYFDDYVLTGDQVTYDQNANTLTAEGNVQIKEPNGNIVRGDKLITTDDFRDAFIQSLSAVGKDDTRIAARRAVRKDGNVTEFENGKFTPCKNDPGQPPLWCVSAQRIVHDQQAASIVYQDAQFELLGVPIFWLPFFSHSDPSAKRRTGFLVPEIGTSSALGTMVTIPYYIAVAPNADFLFHPKYLSKQGELWQGDWRHRIAAGDVRGEYTVKIAGIDQDGKNLPGLVDQATRDKLNGWRGSLQTTGVFSLASWWKFGWDITLESDDTFRRFYKLDSVLTTDRVNTVFLEGISGRNYFSTKFYQLGGLLLQDPAATTSFVSPVIDYNYIFDQPVLGGELSFNGNATNLTRKTGTDSARVSAEANWRRKIVDPLGQVYTPFAKARGDVTRFSDGFNPDLNTAIADETVVRATAAVGLTYSFPFVAHGLDASHIVEPIGQIIVRPNSITQRRLPDEDAKSLVWDDTLLFDTDKFSGYDRIETGTRANVGLQYTFQANKGGYARFIAGQSFQLAGQNQFTNPGLVPDALNGATTIGGTTVAGTQVANFSPRSGLNTDRSDYVLGAYLAPTKNFRIVAQGRFDEQELSLRRANIFSSANLGPLQVATQYSYTRDDRQLNILQSEQEILGAVTLKLTDRWAIGALSRYDIDANLLLQQQYQIKYSDECFVLTATYTDNNITNTSVDLKPDRSLMLRFELKYLGDFRYKTDLTDNAFGTNAPPK